MNLLFDEKFLNILEQSNNNPFRIVETKEYKCIEYDIKLNILTFCKFSLPIKLTIISLPVSICEKGYEGNIDELIKDYKKKKGIYLILNDDEKLKTDSKRSGNTLPTCIFNNTFVDFSDYLNSLRSSYRRRIKKALNKGKDLRIERVDKDNFTNEMYSLYLDVVKKSKYPLEILKLNFFKLLESDIFCFYQNEIPIAFIQLKQFEETLYFIFGGMNYKYRDKYDLYYNMLLFIVNYGIKNKCKKINFGQTAEISKVRIGCVLKNKYMHVVSGNKIIDFILIKLIKFLEYKFENQKVKIFK